MYAAANGDTYCALELVKAGADVNIIDNQGETAFSYATQSGNLECLKELLATVGDNFPGQSAAIDASSIAASLIAGWEDNGNTVNNPTKPYKDKGITPQNQTALMVAAYDGQTEWLTELLSRGSDVNQRDKNGYTALIYASRKGHPRCVKELLRAGADVNASDCDRELTSLMFAASSGQVECLQELLLCRSQTE